MGLLQNTAPSPSWSKSCLSAFQEILPFLIRLNKMRPFVDFWHVVVLSPRNVAIYQTGAMYIRLASCHHSFPVLIATPGNMCWLAKCEHVRHLINPRLFPQEMDRIVHKRTKGAAVDVQDKLKHCYVILGRYYAAEHWINSHPLVSSCDCQRMRNLCGDTMVFLLGIVQWSSRTHHKL